MSTRNKTSTRDLLDLLRRPPNTEALALARNVPHTLTFTLDDDDLVQAERRWVTHEYLTRTVRGWLVMVGLIPAAFIAVIAVSTTLAKGVLTIPQIVAMALPAVIGAAAIGAVVVAIHRRMVRLRRLSTPDLAEMRTVHVDADGVTETFASGKRAILWSSVREATVDQRQIYIRFDGSEMLIPRRAFFGSGHLEGFLTLISAYRRNMVRDQEASWPPKPGR